MRNVLTELRRLVDAPAGYVTGVVIRKQLGSLVVRLPSGVERVVIGGDAALGASVLVQGDRMVAEVATEQIKTLYVD